MDDPRLARGAHLEALRGLGRIYCLSRTGTAVWPRIRREARASAALLRLLDIATGGGDLPMGLASAAPSAVGLHVGEDCWRLAAQS
jgi:hypothetical protein